MTILIIIGIVLLGLGGLFIFLRRSVEEKIFQIKVTDTKNVKEIADMCKEIAEEVGPGGYHEVCEVKGLVRTDNPITSEIGKKPCVYYEMSVTREWEETYYETDSDGNRERKTRKGHDTVASNKQHVDFWLEDDSGKIIVAPLDADIEPMKIVDKFQPAEGTSSSRLSFMGLNLDISPSSSSGRRTIGYHYKESILPVDRRVYVLGEASDSSGELKIKLPSEKGKKFLISLKSEEEILADAAKKSNIFKYLSIASFVIGIILVIIGIIK
jgi:hypothetical protein